jgi:hypothetical protein
LQLTETHHDDPFTSADFPPQTDVTEFFKNTRKELDGRGGRCHERLGKSYLEGKGCGVEKGV